MGSYRQRGRIVLTIALDTLAITAAFYIALTLRFEFAPPLASLAHFTLALPLIVLVFLGSFALLGIYSRSATN